MNDTPQQPTAFTYYAFISYSHKDEKWAKWIQNALERYRLPAAVRKEAGKPLPSRIHPVFRDATDLGVGKLADNLKQELEQSKYLIVVCSPNSARPNEQGKHWVNEEVARFCELGHADRIIPVIVEGSKDSAYCPKLAEEDILGLDATKHPKARILNDLVAKILGLRPDELWRREERRLRAKRRWKIFGFSLVASLIALGGLVAWDCTHTVTRAFADYVDSYGLPEGIFPLTKEEVAHRHIHYRFEFKGYRCEWFGKSIHADSAAPSLLRALGFRRILKRVVQANSFGIPREIDHDYCVNRPVILDFSRKNDYRPDGSLQEYYRPRFGDRDEQHYKFENDRDCQNASMSMKGAGGSSTTFSYLQGAITRNATAFEPVPGIAAPTMTRISKAKIIRDSQGRNMGERFLASDGEPASDIDGIFGYDRILDEHGRVIEEAFLSRRPDGKYYVRENRIGIAIKRFRYEKDRLVEITQFDSNGNPAVGENGFFAVRFFYDENGNVAEEQHFDVQNVLSRDRSGVARFRFAYDKQGNRVCMESLSESGALTKNNEGIAKFVAKFDAVGNETEWRYFGEDGLPAETSQGFASVQFQRDKAGRITRVSSYDGMGYPIPGAEGQFSLDTEYDSAGRPITMSYRDADGKPMRGSEGFAIMAFDYDDSGNLEKTSFWGPNGEPVANRLGVHQNRFKWNEYGHGQEGHAYYGTNGLPVVSREGFHRVSYETRRGRIASETYYSTTGLQTLTTQGFSRITHQFDRMGNVTNETYWAPDGSMAPLGPAGWNAKYDDFGNGILVQSFGPDGNPADNGQGIVSVRRVFDKQGRMTDEIGEDKNGKQIANAAGFVRRHCEYDIFGRIIKETLFDDANLPMAVMGEACSTQYEYDSLGRLTCKAWLDSNEKLANNDFGFAEIQFELDRYGRPLRTSYRDKFGSPVAGPEGVPAIERHFNALGRMIGWEFQNGYGKRIADPNGIAGQTIEYDPMGNTVRIVYLGVSGGRVFGPQGVAEIVQTYDEKGNRLSETYIAPDGSRIHGPWGVGEIRYRYDERGNSIWQGFFDIDGTPMDGTEGFSVMECEYDSANHLTKRSLSAVTPLAKAILASVNSQTREYDERGILTCERNHSQTGGPACGLDGWAERRVQCNQFGKPILEFFLDENGEKVPCGNGLESISTTYWNNGMGTLKTRERNAAAENPQLFGLNGLACVRECFSQNGILTNTIALASDGSPYEWPDAVATIVHHVAYGGQAYLAGVRPGDIFFACGTPDTGFVFPVLDPDLPGEEESEKRQSFFALMGALLNAKEATIVFARFEGGMFSFFDVVFHEGNALDANNEILVATVPFKYMQAWTIKDMYKHRVPHVVLCAEILKDSHAEKAGITVGDIVMEYGSYSFAADTRMKQVASSVKEMENKEKRLTVARKQAGKWDLKTFSLPSGPMGIRMAEGLALKDDYLQLLQLTDSLSMLQ